MDNKDFDFIKDKFERAKPEIPPSLDEKAIENKILSGQKHKTVKFRKNRNGVKAFVAAAACFALVFGTVFAVHQQAPRTPETPMQPAADENSAVLTFKSYDEINGLIGEIVEMSGDMVLKEPSDANGSSVSENAYESAPTEGHSETYVQTDGVDEASSVKTDGKYIHYAHYSYNDDEKRNKVYIFKADNGKTEAVSEVTCKCNSDSAYIHDIFLYDNRLIVNLSDSNFGNTEWTPADNRDTSAAVTEIYDISNPTEPSLISDFEQSGYYVTSRMINNTVYVVSNYSVYSKNEKYSIPQSGCNSRMEKLAAGSISYFKDTRSAQYNVIGAIDASSGRRAAETRAVLGCLAEVYCNEKICI